MELKGKVVLVTGASRGIGRKIAERFAKEGADIVLADISPKVEQTALEISKLGVTAIGVAGSVADEKDVKKIFEEIQKKFKRLDICINNAGISINSLTMRTSFSDFNKVIDVNLKRCIFGFKRSNANDDEAKIWQNCKYSFHCWD